MKTLILKWLKQVVLDIITSPEFIELLSNLLTKNKNNK